MLSYLSELLMLLRITVQDGGSGPLRAAPNGDLSVTLPSSLELTELLEY